MTGIENITAIIIKEAEENARQIISEAEEKAKILLDKAKITADEKAADIEKESTLQARDILERAKSAAELEKKKCILKAKQEIISDIISEAKNKLENLSDEEYFKVLIRLVEKYATSQEGEMVLGSRDLERLPKDFKEKVNAAAKGCLSISDKSADIKNGFLLIYGGIDINCTFDALFEDSAERLQDIVASKVF